MANMRVTFNFGEFSTRGASNLVSSEVVGEFSTRGRPNLLASEVIGEFSTRGRPKFIVTGIILEHFTPLLPEEVMVDTPFPGFGNSVSNPAVPAARDPFNTALPGLSISVHKKPELRTNIKSAASGKETRVALMEYPIWNFELGYEFLEDSSGSESSLKTIQGFFLQRYGSYDLWLFKDPDSYQATNSWCGDADGVTTTFNFHYEINGFNDLAGQVDQANTINLYEAIVANSAVPVTPGPYTVTFADVLPIVDAGVVREGVTMTKVVGAPASLNQYSVDETTGVYTFYSTAQGDSIVVSYSYTIPPADYTITLPNRIVFDVAPPEGTITGTFQYFYVCRFSDDMLDFEKFADKLWNLQQVDFRTVP